MKFEKLGNIAEIIAGQSPPSSAYNKEGEGIPFFQGKADYGKRTPIVRNWTTITTKISLPGDILISVRAPVGPVIFNDVQACIGRGLSAIRIRKNVSSAYVYYFLKAHEKQIADLGVGSTFTAITQKDLNALTIPLPEEYDDQIRIAELLSKAEALIDQRKESIDLLDEFLRSTFLEMFGDPVRNEKGWEKSPLKKYAKVRIGPFGSLLHQEDYIKDGIPLINPTHINSGKIFPDNNLTISKQKADALAAYIMHKNDVILGRRGEIGRCAVITDNEDGFLCGTGSIFIRPEKGLSSIFLYSTISTSAVKKVLESSAKGITMKNLNSQLIEDLNIPIPPLPIQNKFADIVEKVEKLKTNYQDSLKELENLFGSLSQRAFKGELNVDKINLPETGDPFEGVELPEDRLLSLDDLPNKENWEIVTGDDLEEKPLTPKVTELQEEKYDVISPYFLQPFIESTFSDRYFTFQQLKGVFDDLDAEYDVNSLRDTIFEMLRKGHLSQYYVDAEFVAGLAEDNPNRPQAEELPEQIHLRCIPQT